MASVRGRSVVLALVAGAALALAAPAAAWAEDPVDFGSTPIVDTVGALGGSTDEVLSAIDRAADSGGRQLFVAYVDEFTNPEAADAWANDTAVANNMGAEDYLLAVAVDGRAYYLSAASDASLSAEDIARISSEVIEPELRDEDWAGAAIAAADALAGGAGGGGSGWGWVWFLVIAAVVVAIIAIVLARRKKRKQVGAEGAGGPAAQLASLDDLRREAGGALVQADDAVKTSEEELGFAVASYGEESTADFRGALEGAKAKVAEAFALQQQLDDAQPDTDDERRAWYGGIIRLTGEADALLDEQAERFDALRDLERNAPAELQRVQTEADAAAAAHRARGRAAQLAHGAVRGIRGRIRRRQPRAGRGSHRRSHASRSTRRRPRSPKGARTTPPSRSARPRSPSTRRPCSPKPSNDSPPTSPPPTRPSLQGSPTSSTTCRRREGSATRARQQLADRVAADAAQLRATIGAPGRDPLAAQARIEQVNAEIDAAIAGARDAAEQAAAGAGATRPHPHGGARPGACGGGLHHRPPRRGRRRGTHAARGGRRLARRGRGHGGSPIPRARSRRRSAPNPLAGTAISLAQNDVGGFGGRLRRQVSAAAAGRRLGRRRPASAPCSAASSSTRCSAAAAAAAASSAVAVAVGGGFGGGGRRSPGSFGGGDTRPAAEAEVDSERARRTLLHDLHRRSTRPTDRKERPWQSSPSSAASRTLLRANINALLDSAEDPQKMLDQLVRDFTNSIADAEVGDRRDDRQPAPARGRPPRRRRGRARMGRQGPRGEPQGRRAAHRGRRRRTPTSSTTSRRSPSAARSPRRTRRRRPSRQIAAQTEVVDKLKAGLNGMKEKLVQLQNKRSELVARAKTAEAQNQVHDAVKSIDVLDPTSEIGRFEDKIRREEAVVRGQAELAASSLDAQFNELDDLGELTEVDARLAALKAGGTSQGAISG